MSERSGEASASTGRQGSPTISEVVTTTVVPRIGDFGLARGGGVTGWLVRLGTFSRYGHAAVVARIDPTRTGANVEIVEAARAGARRRWIDPDAGEFIWSRCPLTTEQRVRIALEADRCVSLPYDYRDIAAFVLRFFGAKIRGRSADHPDGRLICSELCVWTYRVAGHEIAPSPDVAPGDVSPGDLADHITREA